MKVASISSQRVTASNCRLEGKFFLNDNSYLSMVIEELPNTTILGNIATVFNPPVFKRQFCKKTPRSVQYFQSSDVQYARETSDVYVFRKQAEKLNLLVNKGDILVTGFGTIGNTRIVSALQDRVCYANNVCRIRIGNGQNVGYVYAFLSSKYGVAQLNKNASGSVVRYIEALGIKKTIIPLFPEEFRRKVDEMIQESARLREEAAIALDKAHKIVEELYPCTKTSVTNAINIKSILRSHNTRFEGAHFVSANRQLYENITSCPHNTLGELSERIFRPGIFKRVYVDKGITFLGGADIMLANPTSDKRLSRKQVEKMPELKVQPGWILITCGGTIGNVVYVDNQLSSCVISQHVMRVVPKKDAEIIFAFLSSKIGKLIIELFTYGSVIPSVENHHLELIPIPIFANSDKMAITEHVKTYVESFEKSKRLELEAIAMVETEIEQMRVER